MKIKQRVVSIGLAVLAVASMTATASASGKDSDTSPLRAVEVTVAEHAKTETVVDGKVTKVEESAPSSVSHFFSPQAPDYRGDSVYSHFTGQVRYHDGAHLHFAWSEKLHANVSATATGPMAETASVTRNGRRVSGYHDDHGAIPANYLMHSSFQVDTSHYVLTVNKNFRTGRSTKYITTVFDFTVTLI